MDIVGVVLEDHPASGFMSCAYVGVDPTASNDHAAIRGSTVGPGVPGIVGDAVVDTVGAGVPDSVAADVPEAVSAGVLEADAPWLEAGLLVLTGVVVSADVAEEDAVKDGVPVAAGVVVAAAVPAGVDDATGVAENTAGKPVKTTLSMVTVPPDPDATGLGASLTQKPAALSAPAPRDLTPDVAEPVARYTALVPYVEPEPGSRLTAVAYETPPSTE